MAYTREKSKGRKSNARVCVVPHSVLNHPHYVSLSATAVRLFWEMAMQYNGTSNNGDLTASWSIMKGRGFNSKATLAKCLAELLEKGFLLRTREGRFCNPGKRCALYAITWKPINECPGKDLDVGPTIAPPNSFTARIINLPGSETVPTRPKNCTEKGRKHG